MSTRILICGAGAIGSNLTANLASARVSDEICVLDYDKIELRNIEAGTQLYMRDQVSKLKVDALQYNIYRWLQSKIKIIIKKFNGYSDGEYDLVVDCFDNYESRKLLQDWVRKNKIECLHVGFSSKMTFEIEWDEFYEVPEDDLGDFDVCEAMGARGFIQSVAGMASSVVLEYLESGDKLRLIGNRFVSTKIN